VENYIHAKSIFSQKYENNYVTWSGYYVETKPTRGMFMFASDHAKNILIKMSPSESSLYADLVLSISTTLMKQNEKMFASLKKGDELEFKAQFVSLGNEFKMHHLHTKQIKMTGGFKKIEEIIIKESSLPGH